MIHINMLVDCDELCPLGNFLSITSDKTVYDYTSTCQLEQDDDSGTNATTPANESNARTSTQYNQFVCKKKTYYSYINFDYFKHALIDNFFWLKLTD